MEALGAYLKEQREARRLSVDELAQTTRIPARILRQIELGLHAELPADVFVRGFLRAYAVSVAAAPRSAPMVAYWAAVGLLPGVASVVAPLASVSMAW